MAGLNRYSTMIYILLGCLGLVYVAFFEWGPPDDVVITPVGSSPASTGGLKGQLDTSKQSPQHEMAAPRLDLKNPSSETQQQKAHNNDDVSRHGYFSDFFYDREHPAFRQDTLPNWHDTEDHVHAMLPNQGTFRSCQYFSDDGRLLIKADPCLKADGVTLIVYNSLSVARHWCDGKTVIGPQSAARIESSTCHVLDGSSATTTSSPTFFSKAVIGLPSTGASSDVPPIVIQSHDGQEQNVESISCDVPCQQEKGLDQSKENLRYIQGEPSWKIYQSADDPQRNRAAQIQRTSYRKDYYYSTTSFQSSVPLSSFEFEKYPQLWNSEHQVQWKDIADSASYIQSVDCNAQATKRGRWSGSVMNKYHVASYGKCSHNTDVPDGMSIDSKDDRIALRRRHKFDIAIDFGNQKDHISDSIWESLESGTVPILYGANNLGDHLPKGSFIDVGRFQYFDDLADFVVKLAPQQSDWEQYHSWRSNPQLKADFERKYNFTRTSPTCRMCRWAYAKKYGLGWNHQQQVVQETRIPRRLCLKDEKEATTSSAVVTQPFREVWMSGQDNVLLEAPAEADKGACSDGVISQLTMAGLVRTVSEHDNVVDMTFTASAADDKQHVAVVNEDEDLVLRMHFDGMNNKDGSHFPNVHTMIQSSRGAAASSIVLQDFYSRITVLASWSTAQLSTPTATTMNTPAEGGAHSHSDGGGRHNDEITGIVDIVLKSAGETSSSTTRADEIRRVRIIVEDLNELHDKSTEFYPSSFGRLMMQDFLEPLELFYLEDQQD